MTVNILHSPAFSNFSPPLTQIWQVGLGFRAATFVVVFFTALAFPVNREGQGNWRRLQR
jgi:hypothetical protein